MGLRLSAVVLSVVGAIVVLACDRSSPVQPSPPCSVAIDPTTTRFESSGGTGVITVTSPDNCVWSAVASAQWISILTAASGTGGGSIKYSIAPNPSAQPRTGTIAVGGQPHLISQDAIAQSPPECSYTVTPQSAAFGSEGGQGAISVSAPAGCTWTAATADPWISVLQGASGTADGTVVYAVAKQASADTRNGVVHVAGVDVRVSQTGDVSSCQYSVAPVAFTPCMPATTITATVATGSSCPWTATSNASWAVVSAGQLMTGAGAITVSIADNYDAPRSGLVLVRWPTPTQGQNLQIAQAGCSYAVSRNAFSFAAAGGSGSFDVYQSSDPYTCGGPLQDGCVWTPASDSSWIVVSTGTTRGDNPVRFIVATNTTGSTRSGSIRVKDKTVVITQSGS